MSDLYGLLGIPRDADDVQIKSAYRTLARACHPDLRGDEQRFRQISHAYATLAHPARRAAYDAQAGRERAMARGRPKSVLATMAASFTFTVSSGMFVAGLLLGVQANYGSPAGRRLVAPVWKP